MRWRPTSRPRWRRSPRCSPSGRPSVTCPGSSTDSVSASGHYLVDQEVVIIGQASAAGVPGVWIVSPLELDDGRVLLFNRGWLPSTGQVTSPPPGARPPRGRVTVRGLVSETQVQGAGMSPERESTHQESFLRIDVARIQRQFARAARSGLPPADLATPG